MADLSTFWDDVDGHPLYRLAASFEQPIDLTGISLQGWAHHDFSPRDFTVLADGRKLGRIEKARYTDNRLIIELPATSCAEIELQIDGSHGGSPAIREWGIMRRSGEVRPGRRRQRGNAVFPGPETRFTGGQVMTKTAR